MRALTTHPTAPRKVRRGCWIPLGGTGIIGGDGAPTMMRMHRYPRSVESSPVWGGAGDERARRRTLPRRTPDHRLKEGSVSEKASRASMNHQGHGSTGTAGNRKARRGITREAQRKTEGPEAVAWYAKHNPAINPAKTHLNIDMVNDGAGGFRETESIDEVVAYGDDRALRVKPGLRDGNRFAVTTVGHLPWAYLEPDGTEYQPVDAAGVPKLFGSGPKAGQPIREPRYRIKADCEEKAQAYFNDWIEFQAGLLPDGRASMHGYSINLDESRPHIQLLSDPFEAAPSKTDPDRLTNGFSRTFGSHPKDHIVPQLDGHGEPVLLPDGGPKMVREGASRKMERYQLDFRTFMHKCGHEVELERDEARHDRHLDLQDYKDLQHSQREVADTAVVQQNTEQRLAAEIGAAISEREHYDETLVEAYQSARDAATEDLLGDAAGVRASIDKHATEREAELDNARVAIMATLNAEKARVDQRRAAVDIEVESAVRTAVAQWETLEKPALMTQIRAGVVAALQGQWAELKPTLVALARDEGRRTGLADWQQNEKPIIVTMAHTEAKAEGKAEIEVELVAIQTAKEAAEAELARAIAAALAHEKRAAKLQRDAEWDLEKTVEERRAATQEREDLEEARNQVVEWNNAEAREGLNRWVVSAMRRDEYSPGVTMLDHYLAKGATGRSQYMMRLPMADAPANQTVGQLKQANSQLAAKAKRETAARKVIQAKSKGLDR